jgi:hypothetical protein
MEAAELPARRWRYRALAIGLLVLLLGGAGALLLTPDGEPTPAQVLRDVRGFVNAERTATITGVSESRYGAPDDPDVDTEVSRLSGQIHLPDRALVINEDDYSVEETLVSGADVYYRSADSKAELAAEVWEKLSVGGAWGFGAGVAAPPPDVDSAALEDAAAFLTTFSAGFPLDLNTLFERLSNAERVSPTEVKASVTLGELIPDDVRKVLEATEEQFRRQAEMEAAEEEPEEEEDVVVESNSDFDFDVPLDVTVGYGPKGRLDSLTFDVEEGSGDDYTKEHQVFRFSDWGRPVDITPPTGDKVELTPTIDEAALAEMQKQTPVMALGLPPAGWVLIVADVDDDAECMSANLEYGPAEGWSEFNMDSPPLIHIATLSPGCQDELEEDLPELANARTVRIGVWTAKLSDDAEGYTDEGGLVAVLSVNGATVVATSTLPEDQFLAALRSLVPLDLAKQPLAS